MSRFDEQTRALRTAEGVYAVDIAPDWNIGDVPNGGYQVAMLCRAALDALGVPDLLNVSSLFLAPSSPGPAVLHVEVLKRGRSTSAAQARLVQGDRERVRSLILGGDLGSLEGPEYHGAGAPSLPEPEACVHLSVAAGLPTLMDAVDLRADPATAGFMRGEIGGAPELRGYIRFADGSDVDTVALACLTDVAPPTTFNHLGVVGWVPTLELTTQVRRRPAPGWLRLSVATRHISAGHFEEDTEVWDSGDRLVAIARQRAMLLQP